MTATATVKYVYVPKNKNKKGVGGYWEWEGKGVRSAKVLSQNKSGIPASLILFTNVPMMSEEHSDWWNFWRDKVTNKCWAHHYSAAWPQEGRESTLAKLMLKLMRRTKQKIGIGLVNISAPHPPTPYTYQHAHRVHWVKTLSQRTDQHQWLTSMLTNLAGSKH